MLEFLVRFYFLVDPGFVSGVFVDFWEFLCFPAFWDSALCCQRRSRPRRPLSRTLSPERTKVGRRRDRSLHSDSAPPTLQLRTPPPSSNLEGRFSGGPLCFVNPLFLQTHPRRRQEDPPPKPEETSLLEPPPESRNVDQIKPTCKSPPPPRPPPPRSMPRRRPAPPPPGPPAGASRPKSMLEATNSKPQSSVRRPAPPRPSIGSKSNGTTSPRAPPPRPKKPDLEDHRCHIALDDETIAKALSRARLPRSQPPPPAADQPENNAEGPQERARQRLSDMSMSTSSSDSLDNSRSPGFSLNLAPTQSQHLNHQDTVEDSSDEDEDAEEDDDEDYGVGLEADLETRFRPSYKSRRRRVGVSLNGGSFILPRSLKGRFSKVSGMLSSLMTPEKRAVKRVTELSRNKSTYFGCLVQDYVSFVQENRSCHTSGMDFLQTVRQFMTQTKAYLRQTSELDPPIESLIPEDQIGESPQCVTSR